VQGVYPWFAIKVKSRHEKPVATALRGKGFTEFVPLYRTLYRCAGRVRSRELPLFPTYVFGRFDPSVRLPILIIPGVFSIVGIGNAPSPVDETEIQTIQALTASGLTVTPWSYAHVGDPVRIEMGPLTGLEGTLVRLKSEFRLVVSVTLLRRSVSVEVDRDWVQPIHRMGELFKAAGAFVHDVH